MLLSPVRRCGEVQRRPSGALLGEVEPATGVDYSRFGPRGLAEFAAGGRRRHGRLPRRPKMLHLKISTGRDNRPAAAAVAEWQTRWTQNPVWATMCGFKSLLRYSKAEKDLRRTVA